MDHPPGAPVRFTPDELRDVVILRGLPEKELAWFAEHGERLDLAVGEHMFEHGQPADVMFVVVRGAIQRFERSAGQWTMVATTAAGEVTGTLPYSRMRHYPGYTVATQPSVVLCVAQTDFQDMLWESHEIGRRLVAVMSDRVRGDVRLEQQRARMASLGHLSAGLAHELNNPASAVGRASADLAEQLAKLSTLVLNLVRHDVDAATIEATAALRDRARAAEVEALSPLTRAEREETFQDWLTDHGVVEAWNVAGAFADGGLTIADLDAFAAHVPPGVLGDALTWMCAMLDADRTLAEITSAASRISDLVGSIKVYSHMDRSPERRPTDVREGLDNTLTMLGHKLKRKAVRVTRAYQDDLPPIPANVGELNQVWTNLIDNAVDAVDEGGTLRVEARREEDTVAVRVIDDGPGIPDDVRGRIFEPFFTTKGVGEGTGLGLDIALRIARTHQGHIEVQSRPGRTELCVRLPIAPAEASGTTAGA